MGNNFLSQKIANLIKIEKEYSGGESFSSIKLKNLSDKFSSDSFRITVVGEFSVGKSTFLNSLIGKRVLTARRSETTATVTYINNSAGVHQAKRDSVEVHFVQDKKPLIFSINDKDQLAKYTAKSDEFDVAEEVAHVDIFVDFKVSTPFSLLDTPGLNGMAEGHKELTYKQIKSSDACVLIVSAKGISKSNDQLLQYLVREQLKVLIVVNQIDSINEAEGETIDGKVNEIKDYIDSNFDKFDYELFPVAALDELDIKQGKKNTSEFHHYFLQLEKKLKTVYTEIREIRNEKYSNHLVEIRTEISSRFEEEKDMLSSEYKGFSDNFENKSIKLDKQYDRRVRLIKRNIDNELTECRRELEEKWTDGFVESIKINIISILESYHTHGILIAKRKGFSSKINKVISDNLDVFWETELKPGLEEVTKKSILELDTYFNPQTIRTHSSNLNINVDLVFNEGKEITIIKTEIDRMKKVLSTHIEKIEELKKTNKTLSIKKDSTRKKIEDCSDKIRWNNNIRYDDIRLLGIRPLQEKKKKKEGGILGFFQSETIYIDDTKRKNWDQKIKGIEDKCRDSLLILNKKKNDFEEELDGLNNRLRKLKREEEEQNAQKMSVIRRISREEKKKTDASKLKEKKKLDLLRVHINKEVYSYLNTSVPDHIHKTIKIFNIEVEKKLLSYYHKRFKSMKNELRDELKMSDKEKIKLRIDKIKVLEQKIQKTV